MRIRQKLTLSFASTAVLILVLFGFASYYFLSQYRKSEFFNRLLERVEITEKMFLEKENLPVETYDLIREQFLHKLPDETEEVFRIEEIMGTHQGSYPGQFLSDLMADEEAFFERDRVQGVGKIFHLTDGTFVVVLTASDQIGIRMLSYLRTIIVLSLAACIFIVTFVGYYMGGHFLGPISDKIRKANAISAQNLHERLTVKNSDDEIGEMAIAFNKLLDRVTDAFDAQRSFVDNASHEMRNPLTAIIGEAELALEKERSSQEYKDSLSSVAVEANRLNTLVNNLLHLANINRSVPFKREPIEVHALLEEAKRKFDFSCPENKVQLPEKGAGPDLLVEGNGHLLQTAIINIFDNATKFSFSQLVDVKVDFLKDPDRVMISVADKGVGIPPEDIPKVTVPFHRAHNVRQIAGSGIGIPLTQKIIDLHGGELQVSSKLNTGTRVTITLPVTRIS